MLFPSQVSYLILNHLAVLCLFLAAVTQNQLFSLSEVNTSEVCQNPPLSEEGEKLILSHCPVIMSFWYFCNSF